MTFTAKGKLGNCNHATMFILYLRLAVCSFSVKSSSFVLASNRISLNLILILGRRLFESPKNDCVGG